MKLIVCVLLTIILAIQALDPSSPKKQYIVSYEDETPDSILEKTKTAIEAAGGQILSDISLIRGFAASMSEEAVNEIKVVSVEYTPTIEEDQTVSINDLK
ncbi:hypothetical protein MMC10_000118 [Thelotrema lepadinum]|nr:hypothetical protein [Thelotrema lepadinum]